MVIPVPVSQINDELAYISIGKKKTIANSAT